MDHPLLHLFSKSKRLQLSALYDCFALGRSDARVLIALRHLLGTLKGEVLLEAVHILSHATLHPDIVWSEHNWITEEVKEELGKHFIWELHEISHLLANLDSEKWQRGDYGEDTYILLHEDPKIKQKVESVAIEAAKKGKTEVAFSALALTLYWAGAKGIAKYRKMRIECPELENLPLGKELEKILIESGHIELF